MRADFSTTGGVICLAAQVTPDGTSLSVNAVYWLLAPATNTLIQGPTYKPLVPSISVAPAYGYTPTELATLQAGTVAEQLDSFIVPIAGQTGAQVVALLEGFASARWAAAKAALDKTGAATTVHFVGASAPGNGATLSATWTGGP